MTTGKTDFFTAEIEFMKTLFSGEGIDHHMEQNCEPVLVNLLFSAIFFINLFCSFVLG